METQNNTTPQVHPSEWPNYFFFSDFSEHQELLSAMPLGPVSEENQFLLASIISEVDKGVGTGKWTDNSPTNEWGLQGVEIVYNDKNAQRLPTRYRQCNAIGLKFPETSIGPVGVVYLTYVIPELETPTEETPSEDQP